MANTPEWLTALAREASVRSGLVLYGNTRDRFPAAGSAYVTLSEALVRTFAPTETGRPGFTIRAVWDRVDGLRFANPKEQKRWDDALRRQLGGGTAGSAYDLGDEADAPRSTAGRLVELALLIAEYRTVLADKEERPLLVIDWSHLLVSQPAHPDPGEREWLLQVGKALVGQPSVSIDSDSLGTQRGLLVLVSAGLGAVPPVLYQGEPRVRLIAIPAPSPEERRQFFLRHFDDLRVDVVASGPVEARRRATADTLTDLTDQLTIEDLRQIVSLSGTVPQPLRPDRLLNLYRFGDQRSPWEDLDEAKLHDVKSRLEERVIGQDAAVQHVSTMVVRAWLGLAGLQHSARRTKPKGTLFFVGPTGVGKTELAKALAEFLFGDESACIRFDMSEFNHEHSDQRLVGAPPGYVGFEDGGQLTNAVSTRPFSVLLFDEIEKAHGRVLDKFLQILEDGRLTDGRGETAWFSETVIVFTSNIGAANAPKADATPAEYERHFRNAVEEHFVQKLGRPELLNRLGDNVVVFQPVSGKADRHGILVKKLKPLRAHLKERWGIDLDIEPAALDHLLKAARVEHGGRGLLNAIERELMNPLAHVLFENHGKLRKGRSVAVTAGESALDFELVDCAGG